MKRFFIWLGIILATVFIFLLGIFLLFSAMLDSEPVVPSQAYLAIPLSGGMSDYQPPDPLEDYVDGRSADLKRVREALRMAALDDRIYGVVLELGGLQTGLGKLQELSRLIHDFRDSGKQVFAHMDFGMMADYYLATACDSVFMSPEANLFLTGMSAEVMFYKGLLQMAGVEADFVQIGKYKNAPDVYTRQQMTAEQREVINEILDHRMANWRATVAEARSLSVNELDRLIDQVSVFSADEAKQYGLIDAIRYSADVPQHLAASGKRLKRIAVNAYSNISPSSVGLGKGKRIAVIECAGTIMPGDDSADPVMGNSAGSDRIVADLKRAAESRSIEAIILRIDSPGGSALASDLIWKAARDAAEKKPLVASISDVGASGGYYIALAADTILVEKGSIIGSIGIFAGKFSLSGTYEMLNINNERIYRGKNAGLFSLNNKFTDSERAVISRTIEQFYRGFIAKVAEGRRMEPGQAESVGGGRVWDGEDAVRLNLADMTGGLDDAVEVARKMVGIDPAEPVQLRYYPGSRSFLSQLLRRAVFTAGVIENPLQTMRNYVGRLNAKPLALMPFQIDIQ
jgi:protease-4